jgi:hypothetical protein
MAEASHGRPVSEHPQTQTEGLYRFALSITRDPDPAADIPLSAMFSGFVGRGGGVRGR